MKNSIFSRVKLLTGAMLVASVLMFTGCPNPELVNLPAKQNSTVQITADNPLIGTWESSYGEVFTITTTTLASAGTYEGNELAVRKLSDSTGYIYIKYTTVYDWNKGQDEEPENKTGWVNSFGKWYPLNNDLIGKWYGIYYTNLTSTSMKLSGAYGNKSSTDTLEQAVAEFTVENGYFGGNSELKKKTN